jgi:hypothetical protein
MKLKVFSFLNFLIISLINLCLGLELNYLSLKDLPKINAPLKKENSEFSEYMTNYLNLEKKFKRTACVALTRNIIAKRDFKIEIPKENSSGNAHNDFDRTIILKLIKNCESVLSNKQILEIMTPENILTNSEKYMSLVFGVNTNENHFTEDEEAEILGELNLTTSEDEEETDKSAEENSNSNYILMSVGVLAFILLILIIKNISGKKQPIIITENLKNKKNK